VTWRLYSLAFVLLLVSGCINTGETSYYKRGDLSTRQFLDLIRGDKRPTGDYFQVKRNDKGWVVSAKHFTHNDRLREKSQYTYTRKGQLTRYQRIEFFTEGAPRISREWSYANGRVIQREEQWFTRSHSLEKKMTIYYDMKQRVYLEETWGLGRKIESSTEYHYDYYNRLDKSRRNFFLPTGELRDYWLTIYNDDTQIVNEDHYLPDNSLVGFYRYTYHPVDQYREYEEILDEHRGVFISRRYNEYGHLLEESEKDRTLSLIKRTIYEYDDKHRPNKVHSYNEENQLVSTKKYKQTRVLEGYRTPGL